MTTTYNARALALAHEALRARGDETRGQVLDIVNTATGPLTAHEVLHALRTRGKRVDVSYVRSLLKRFADDGLIAARVETHDERVIRFGEKPLTGAIPAVYFFRAGTTVPFRTAVQTVAFSKKTRKTNKKKSKTAKAAAAPARVAATSIDQYIEQLIQHRTAALVRENADLKAQLAQIKSLLSK